MDTLEDSLVMASVKPNIKELVDEFSQCAPMATSSDMLNQNENVRYNKWPGQSTDGRKWDKNLPEGEPAFPWNGASDVTVPLSDDIINQICAEELVAFFRSIPRAKGIEASDIEPTGYITKLLEWMIGTKQYKELTREVELHSQYTLTYGWSVLHITWQQEYQLKLVKQTMQQIAESARQAGAAGNAELAALPQMIMDPEQEDAVVELSVQLIAGITRKRARMAVRELRRTGETLVPMPYLCKNEPCIVALKPWDDVVFHPSLCDIQHGRVFIKERIKEVDLRARIHSDEYDETWVDEAAKQKGVCSTWNDQFQVGWAFVPMRDNDIEIIHSYVRQLDEENIPGIYHTIFHPLATRGSDGDKEIYAKHELLNYAHGKMPFVVRKREHRARRIMSSRGIPEIVSTWQREVKVQRDALVDQTSFGTVPPIIVPTLMGSNWIFGPALHVEVDAPGREPRFMDVPTRGAPVAFDLIETINLQTDRYFGRPNAKIPPLVATIRQQMTVQGNLTSWTEAFQQELQLIEQFMRPDEIQRITGSAPSWSQQGLEIERQYDFILTFDVREMDTDYMQAKLKLIKDAIVPMDVTGRIDRNKLIDFLLRSIDPTLAKELLVDQGSASKQLRNRVKNDVLQMYAGNEPDYVEMDPTAKAQLQFGREILQSNPRYQEAMKRDARFGELMSNWEKNLIHSVEQEQNKQIGLTGVKPMNGQPR